MDTKWIIDSFAQRHMCKSIEMLTDYKYDGKPGKISSVYSVEMFFTGTGSGHITNHAMASATLYLTNVIVVPSAKINVISVGQLINDGFNVSFSGDSCSICKDEKIIMEAKLMEDDYLIITRQGYQNLETTNKEPSEFSSNDNEQENLFQGVIISSEPEDWRDLNENFSNQEITLWSEAMKEEIEAIEKNQVWIKEKPPVNLTPIKCRWTFSIKRDLTGKINKLRARLVAKGCSQKYGLYYEQTYAPVIRPETIRTVLCVASFKNLLTRHCDISSAFLYGQLDETIYMRGPLGPWNTLHHNTYRLTKTLYGLKQAARAWNIRINNSLNKINYQRSKADQCLYIKNGTYILIHVDDLLIVSEDVNEINDVVHELKLEYELKDLGPVRRYLGIIVEHNLSGNYYEIHQMDKIRKLLKQYNLVDSNPKLTPMSTDYLRSSSSSTSPTLTSNELFQKLLGSLMYLGLMTRPDIHLAINLLGRKTEKPMCMDWTCLKRVLQYLKGTLNYKLKLGDKTNIYLRSYCDADWGGDTESRKSTSGQTHFIGNSIISWRSKKQSCIALSTAEAEYVSAAMATQEIIWLQGLLEDMGYKQTLPTSLSSDSLSGIKMATSEKLSNRTKHIDLKYSFLRDNIEKGIITLEYCPSKILIADMFTKPLARVLFNEYVEILRLGMEGEKKEIIKEGDEIDSDSVEGEC